MDYKIDEYVLLKLPPKERLESCKEILRDEIDESLRWDAVWLAGEIAEDAEPNDPIFAEVADLMAWILKHDDSGIVKHEASYQIGMRKMISKIPDLVNSALNDNNGLVVHESIEALGLLNAMDSNELISKSLKSNNIDIKQTMEFVLSRLERQKTIKLKQ